jgi:hypothetical protein
MPNGCGISQAVSESITKDIDCYINKIPTLVLFKLAVQFFREAGSRQ